MNNQAREWFMRAENSERIRAAMEQKRPRYQQYKVNDVVAYYRNGTKSEQGWQGPAKIIGVDNNIIIVKHGQKTIKANIRDFRKFLKGDDEQNAWSTKTDDEGHHLMRNEIENQSEDNLIKTNGEKIEKTTNIHNPKQENMHVENLKTRCTESSHKENSTPVVLFSKVLALISAGASTSSTSIPVAFPEIEQPATLGIYPRA